MKRSPFMRISSMAAVCAIMLSWIPTVFAIDAPRGKIILTVISKPAPGNREGSWMFDLEMLRALPQHDVVDTLGFVKEPSRYTGPLLRDVLAAVGVSGSTIKATALFNSYHAELPFEHVIKFDVIIACFMDGKPIPVRTLGPLIIVYPFDSHPELKTDAYYSFCVWQLRTIEVR